MIIFLILFFPKKLEMKKIKLNNKLNLQKEALVKLQDEQLSSVKGAKGRPLSCLYLTCNGGIEE